MSLVMRHPNGVRIAIELVHIRYCRIIDIGYSCAGRDVIPLKIGIAQVKRIGVCGGMIHRVIHDEERSAGSYTIGVALSRNAVHGIHGEIARPKIIVHIVFLHGVEIRLNENQTIRGERICGIIDNDEVLVTIITLAFRRFCSGIEDLRQHKMIISSPYKIRLHRNGNVLGECNAALICANRLSVSLSCNCQIIISQRKGHGQRGVCIIAVHIDIMRRDGQIGDRSNAFRLQGDGHTRCVLQRGLLTRDEAKSDKDVI